MGQKVNESVSVSLVFDGRKRKNTISKIMWRNRIYKIRKQGLHHTYKRGSRLFHVFSVAGEVLSFRLILDSHSLVWKLEEIYDPNIR
jgi:hypothetical protein